MRKLNLLIGSIVLSVFAFSCLKDEEGDKEKIVEMTVYPETGYTGYFMSDNIYGEFLYISDTDDNEKRLLAFSITEGFTDFEYEKGYEYLLKVKKIWMKDPPQDVSSIKYVYLETISENKAITENSEQEIELEVAPELAKFIPRSESEVMDALFVKEKDTNNWWPLLEIEGFDYEEGFEYTLKVNKVVQAEPYSVSYVLVDILSQEEENE